MLVTYNGTKVTRDMAVYCPPLAGVGGGLAEEESFARNICIHNKGVFEVVKKSSPPPAPPPAGDMTDSTQIRG